MRTFAVSQSDSEKADDEENDDDDSEYKEDDELANVDYQEDESTVARPEIFGRLSRLGRKTMPKEPLSDNSMEGFEALEESGSPVTRSEAARTHNSQVSEEFFASSDDETTQGHDVSQHKTRYMRAEDYLRNTLARLDKGPKQLLLAKPPGVRLIDIRRENIDLRKKRQ
ncbi:hypothetical protein BGW39_005158 [Mortierella sp. 14UC]|nr:hypothetical protein BGW39_005158 [Mortierella sp. 14UC]